MPWSPMRPSRLCRDSGDRPRPSGDFQRLPVQNPAIGGSGDQQGRVPDHPDKPAARCKRQHIPNPTRHGLIPSSGVFPVCSRLPVCSRQGLRNLRARSRDCCILTADVPPRPSGGRRPESGHGQGSSAQQQGSPQTQGREAQAGGCRRGLALHHSARQEIGYCLLRLPRDPPLAGGRGFGIPGCLIQVARRVPAVGGLGTAA